MSSTSPYNKKRKDLTLTTKLAELGFKEIYSLGNMLILDTGTQKIHCKLNYNDLIKTTEKYLRSSLDKSKKFSNNEKEIICTEICEIIVDSINQQIDEERKGKQQDIDTTWGLLDEIDQLLDHFPNLTFGQWQTVLQGRYQ